MYDIKVKAINDAVEVSLGDFTVVLPVAVPGAIEGRDAITPLINQIIAARDKVLRRRSKEIDDMCKVILVRKNNE